MIAEVYAGAVEYGRSSCWNTPPVVDVPDAAVELGVAWIQCQDCFGTGHFPMPFAEPALEDFCVRCKGSGLVGCSV